MSFEISGRLHKIFPTEQKTETFKAREFVIETSGEYPQFVKFQTTQDRCNLLDKFEENNTVKVSFDLRGREWQGKYFTNLNAWRIESGDGVASQDQGNDEQFFNQEVTSNNNTQEIDSREDLDDLPF